MSAFEFEIQVKTPKKWLHKVVKCIGKVRTMFWNENQKTREDGPTIDGEDLQGGRVEGKRMWLVYVDHKWICSPFIGPARPKRYRIHKMRWE